MAEDQKKNIPPPAAGSSQPAPVQPQSQRSVPIKKPIISRRAFLIGAIGASTLLTAAAFAQSALPPDFGILGPLIPSPEQPTVIANANSLETKYQAAITANSLDSAFGSPSTNFSEFFSWPYPISVSPYFKNIVVRLPDDKYLQQPTSDEWNGANFTSTPVSLPGSTTGSRFVAFNTTCVHLRCLVNPGFGGGQFRLQCPCHGSQYNLADGVPVEGPAFDLGLNPLPKIELKIDTAGNITATNIVGQPGIGRTTQ